MTQYEKPASRVSRAGLSVVHVSGGTRRNVAKTTTKLKASGLSLNPPARAHALLVAHELNAAAAQCRRDARTNPGAIGLTLNSLAGHYARMAADWFGRAETTTANTGGQA